jgi:NAD(P)-dependent dehydrogenase (short-subunit alcohol dehydrogenase family)
LGTTQTTNNDRLRHRERAPECPAISSKLGLSEADPVGGRVHSSQIPTGRFGKPSEIAHAIVFLASDESALAANF